VRSRLSEVLENTARFAIAKVTQQTLGRQFLELSMSRIQLCQQLAKPTECHIKK